MINLDKKRLGLNEDDLAYLLLNYIGLYFNGSLSVD